MRKDKGLNGDGDRLPMLTWMMFLKFLDDHEQVREAEAQLAGEKFKPAIEAPYRWRDWVLEKFNSQEITIDGEKFDSRDSAAPSKNNGRMHDTPLFP
jgi:hypothetical protein